MCLIVFAYHCYPDYPLVLAANRDEFYARPTAPLAFWEDHPSLLAGRDLKEHGTWMGITTGGRIAAITNYRDPHGIKAGAPSRGRLVSDFLIGDTAPSRYLESISAVADQYNGFNLIVGDATGLFYFSNYVEAVQEIEPGIHGLSNHLLNTPWPKVERCKHRFETALQSGDALAGNRIWEVMTDQHPALDEHLPDTGIDPAWERALSSIFIATPGYGTRSSSVVTVDRGGRMAFTEITWQTEKPAPEEALRRSFNFRIRTNAPS